MHCRLLTQYAIVMVQFLAGLRKIKLLPAQPSFWILMQGSYDMTTTYLF